MPERLPAEKYHEYILSPEWKAKADAAKARAGYKCQLCSSRDRIVAHHNTYDRLGFELDEDICVLCNVCHERFHAVVNGKPTIMPGRTGVKARTLKMRKKRLTRRQKRAAKRAALQNHPYDVRFMNHKDWKRQQTRIDGYLRNLRGK